MNVFIFATSIYKEKDALNLTQLLKHYFRIKSINFDLDDRDKILRIESPQLKPARVTAILTQFGYKCRELK